MHRNLLELDNSEKILKKIQNLKKFERFKRFWTNLIPKFVDGCNIFVISFGAIARILR